MQINSATASSYYANLSPLQTDVTSFNEHYVVEIDVGQTDDDVNLPEHTILLTIKEFFIKNPDFFDIYPLQRDKFKNIVICRVAQFPNEEDAFQKVNLCFDPKIEIESVNNNEFKRKSMNYGHFVITWDGTDEYNYQVVSYAIWIFSGFCILLCIVYFVKIGCEKCCKKKEASKTTLRV